MTTTINIVKLESDASLLVVHANKVFNNKIVLKQYGDDFDDYESYEEKVDVVNTFSVITTSEFLLNPNDTSKLNAITISGGFGEVNRLAYAFSVTIVNLSMKGYTHKIWPSDVIYTNSGVMSTRHDMYSYHHDNEYYTGRLEYEVFDSLDLNTLLSDYLNTDDIRNNKLEQLINK